MKNKPKILIIQQSPDWGGAEEWIASLVRLWSDKVNIVTYTNLRKLSRSFKKSGAKTESIHITLDIIGNIRGLIKSIIRLPRAYVFYKKMLLKEKADIVLMSGFSEKMLVTFLLRKSKTKVVWFEYGPLKEVFKKNLYLPKYLYNNLSHIPKKTFTISNNTKQSLIKETKIPAKNIRMIYPGVNIPKKIYWKNGNVVGILSRISKEKGQDVLIKAFKSVTKEIPQAKLSIAGKGPGEEKLKNLVKSLKLEKNVKFQGFVKDKNKFYQQCSIFVFPTVWDLEGFGLVAAESLSHGIPTIGFDSGPVSEIIDETVGQLIPPSQKNLEKAIIKMLKSSNKAKSVEAIKKAKENFNEKIQAKKILEQITSVI
ncbi:glycosyltransferase family 4 protein [Patescibacteria group bacterium]